MKVLKPLKSLLGSTAAAGKERLDRWPVVDGVFEKIFHRGAEVVKRDLFTGFGIEDALGELFLGEHRGAEEDGNVVKAGL